jgi:energy-coupling factor transporter ATP-binding protein EcfA2
MLDEQEKQDNGKQEPENEEVQNDRESIEEKSKEKDIPDSSKDNTEPTSSQKIDIEKIEGDTDIAQVIKKYYLGAGGSYQRKKFSFSDTYPFSEKLIEIASQTFVYSKDQVETLISTITSNRTLILTGEPECGKSITSVYLATLLNSRNDTKYEIRTVYSLDKEIIVDLLDFFKNCGELKEKILIFHDVFKKKNLNLKNFFDSYSKEQSEFISSRLRELNSFIIFTADNGTFDKFVIPLLDISHEIKTIEGKQLEEAYHKKLERFVISTQRDENSVDLELGKKKEIILKELATINNVSLFVDTYLEKIISKAITIDEAIEEASNIKKRVERWFLKELGGNNDDFESWTCALCLALWNGASYTDFGEFHKKVTKKILRELTPFKSFINFTFSKSENNLLLKCKSQISKNMQTHADIIEFSDEKYQEVLIEILLLNNRKILLDLINLMQEIVENENRDTMRRLAAYAIGKIGELDIESIILPLLYQWASKEEPFLKASVGYLYEGIWESNNKNYRKHCLAILNDMALHYPDNTNIQWAAISAYRQIGIHDLKFALKELRKILEKTIEGIIEWLDAFRAQDDSLDEESALINLKFLHENMEKKNDLLFHIPYSIISMSIKRDPIEVISELAKWISQGNKDTRAFLVIFFLDHRGIFDELESLNVVYFSENDDENASFSNILLNSLTITDDAVKTFAKFLKGLYEECFSEYRSDAQPVWRYRLFNKHMRKWVVDSLSNKNVSKTVEGLIVELYNLGNDSLKGTLYNAMNQWKIRKPNKKRGWKDKKDKSRTIKKQAKLDDFVDSLVRQLQSSPNNTVQ